MSVIITSRLSKNGKKIRYYFEWGKLAGQRISAGIFSHAKPQNIIEKKHNKEVTAILETKKSQLILDHQAINSGYIPQHKLKNNFLDYYGEFVRLNSRTGNRHLLNSLNAFRKFLGRDYVSALEITEPLCERFRTYLLDNFNGETPSGYFTRFKRMLRAARKDGYFKISPAQDLVAISKKNKKIKHILTEEEYSSLLATPCLNHEVKKAFVFSLYTGLRWTDIKKLCWDSIRSSELTLTQKKTGTILELPLHPIAVRIIGAKKSGLVFKLPCQDGANKALAKWCADAGVTKHITWHCARHSFSVLLQRKGTDLATVAGMLGHTTTKYVHQTYQRYVKNTAIDALRHLPSAEF